MGQPSLTRTNVGPYNLHQPRITYKGEQLDVHRDRPVPHPVIPDPWPLRDARAERHGGPSRWIRSYTQLDSAVGLASNAVASISGRNRTNCHISCEPTFLTLSRRAQPTAHVHRPVSGRRGRVLRATDRLGTRGCCFRHSGMPKGGSGRKVCDVCPEWDLTPHGPFEPEGLKSHISCPASSDGSVVAGSA